MATSRDSSSHLDRGLSLAARFVSYLIYWYLVVVELVLALGFVLLVFGANPDSEFTRWVYRSVGRSMGPFRGIFEPLDIGSSATTSVSAVLDTSILFAMVAYGVVLVAVGSLIDWLTRRIRRDDLQRQLDDQYDAYRASLAPPQPRDLATIAAQADAADQANYQGGQTNG